MIALLGASALPAYADTPKPGDPFGGETVPPGPVIIITPGNPGDGELPPPSDPDEVEEQIKADQEKATATPSATPGSTPGPGAPGATDGPGDGASPSDAEEPASGSDGATAQEDESGSVWMVVGGFVLVGLGVASFWYLQRRRKQ